MKTLIYGNGGDNYYGEKELSNSDITNLKKEYKEKGAIGYMSGYRYWNNERENVIVFFNEKPIDITAEQNRRRKNGFKSAKWHKL
jgi:hypothetical protein